MVVSPKNIMKLLHVNLSEKRLLTAATLHYTTPHYTTPHLTTLHCTSGCLVSHCVALL